MVTVTARAIGGERRTVGIGRAVVAIEEGPHSIGRRLYFVFSRSEAWQRLQTSLEISFVEPVVSDSILCSEWQSVQVGHRGRPRLGALPWTLWA